MIAHSWTDLFGKGLSAILILGLLYYASDSPDGYRAFSDKLSIMRTVGFAALIGFGIVFGVNLLFMAPYKLWKDAEERADKGPEKLTAAKEAYSIEQAKQRAIDQAENRRQMRKNTYRLFGGLGSGLEDDVKDREAEREAEREIRKQKRIRDALQNQPISAYDMPLRDVIKHIAFESNWAVNYDDSQAKEAYRPHSTTEYKWTYDLSSEFLHATPELISRGIHQQFKQKPNNGRSDIPDTFWQKAEVDVIDMLTTDFASIAFIDGEEVYRDIVFERQEIEARWPPRPKSRKWTAFKKLIKPYREGADHRAAFNEEAWGNIA